MCAQPLKDSLDRDAVVRIAGYFRRVDPAFDEPAFVAQSCEPLDTLELKDRVLHIAHTLRAHLPEDYPAALEYILRAAEIWPSGEGALHGFAAWPMTDFIGLYGLAHPEESLAAMRRLTHLFSAEFAIRPFLIEHTELTMRHLHDWIADDSEHVRRLVSEGTRPRLPWGIRLKQFQADPSPALPLLEALKDDPSDYVRRSVANHLNDISKDHPDIAVAVCARWRDGSGEHRQWIVRQALRGLVKQGDARVFPLLGYSDTAAVELRGFTLSPTRIRLGDSIDIAFELVSTSDEPQKLIVDYAVHHRKANGSQQPKVFKLTTLELPPRGAAALTKRHAVRKITTRQYYAGTQSVEVLVNGRAVGRQDFELEL